MRRYWTIWFRIETCKFSVFKRKQPRARRRALQFYHLGYLSLCFLPGVKAGQLKHCLLQKIQNCKETLCKWCPCSIWTCPCLSSATLQNLNFNLKILIATIKLHRKYIYISIYLYSEKPSNHRLLCRMFCSPPLHQKTVICFGENEKPTDACANGCEGSTMMIVMA